MENIGDYYVRMLSNIDLLKGETIGISIIFSWLGLFTMIYLFILASLILRARPTAAENRFMFLLLIAEGFKATFDWKYLYPFGPEMMPVFQYVRVVWYFFLILSLLLYISVCAFYPVKFFGFMNHNKIRNNLYWILPLFSFFIIFSLISTNDGIGNTFGNMYYVKCLSADQQPMYESYPIVDNDYQTSCFDTADYHPFAYFINESTPLSILLVWSQVIFSFIAVVFMKNAISNLKKSKANLERVTEARAMFIGFTGKTIFQGTAVAFMIFLLSQFGRINLADVSLYLGQEYKIGIFMIGLYGFTFSILATALFQGVMFTYAILKNEILGIDQRLRSVFSNAVFAAIGGILLLVASEIMESLLGFGWIGSVVIGIPMILLRKPIISILNRLSGALMPDSLTKNDKIYLDAYQLAMVDGLVTEKERNMLSFQAKTLGINADRIKYLEIYFDDQQDN
tara:strand:+ start:69 stop:1430 length:1362 start_codon:yes stop_codon:yes gene_type:complete